MNIDNNVLNASCFACKYSQDPPYPLLDGKFWKLYLSEDQAYAGRSYLNLKTHKSSLNELSDDEWKEYKELVRKIEPVYKEIFHSELINWSLLMNNAFIENTTPHVHWHLRPRHSKPVIIDGEEFIDGQFGYHYDDNARRMPNERTMKAIVSEIAKGLDG